MHAVAEESLALAPRSGTAAKKSAPPSSAATSTPVPAVPGLTQTAPALRRTVAVGAAYDPCERDAEETATRVVAYLKQAATYGPEQPGPAAPPDALRTLARSRAGGSSGSGADAVSASAGPDGGPLEPELDREIARTRGQGQPLPVGLRTPLESAFGADFGAVRLHTGPDAGRLNRQIGARAFTLGADIYLGQQATAASSDDTLHVLAHELTHTVQQGAARTCERSVQRAIGIEFEFAGLKTSYKQAVTGSRKDLKRKEPILTGAGFALEADDLETYSDAEFVTDAFPETAAGGNALVAALTDIGRIISALEGQALNTPISAAQLQAAVPGTNARDNRWVERIHGNPLVGKPQVTAGVRLDAMDELFRQISATPGAAGAGNEAATFFGGQMAPSSGMADNLPQSTGIPDVGAARAAVPVEVAALTAIDAGAGVLANEAGLQALLTQLALYLGNGAVGSPGYGKLIAGSFMSRTHFAALFGLLPLAVRTYFTTTPQRFVDLALDVARRANPAAGAMLAAGSVFEGGIYNDPLMYGTSKKFQSTMPALTRQAWLAGIVANQDLMTADMYPARWWQKKKVKEEMQGLGSYGANTDALPTPGGPAPIVEFRGLKPIFGHLLLPMALDVFRYVHSLNTLGAAAVFPGEMLNLGINDRMDLIQDQGNVLAVRQQAIVNATADFQNW